jgi:CBS domain-containing protein
MECPACSHENIEGVDECARCKADLSNMTDQTKRSDIEQDMLDRPLGELMTQDFIEVPPDRTVGDMIQAWNQQGQHCAMVTDGGSVVGIFTERDVLYKLADKFDGYRDNPVRDYMTPDPETLRDSDPIAFALNRMMVGGYRHIPIVSDGALVGIVSVRDILAYLTKQFGDVITAGSVS